MRFIPCARKLFFQLSDIGTMDKDVHLGRKPRPLVPVAISASSPFTILGQNYLAEEGQNLWHFQYTLIIKFVETEFMGILGVEENQQFYLLKGRFCEKLIKRSYTILSICANGGNP